MKLPWKQESPAPGHTLAFALHKRKLADISFQLLPALVPQMEDITYSAAETSPPSLPDMACNSPS
jgi:hypothetical protein